jgi:hypothetical protein
MELHRYHNNKNTFNRARLHVASANNFMRLEPLFFGSKQHQDNTQARW